MKQFLWLAGFVLLVFAGDRLGGKVLEGLVLNSQFRYSRLYTGRADCDVLLLGNSRGLAFYQPYIEERTGLKTLNLSYNGLPVHLADALIRDYFDRYPPPKVVVIEISLCDRLENQLVMNFSPYYPYSPRIRALIGDANPQLRAGLEVSHLLRYNSEVFQRAMFYLQKPDKYWQMDRTLAEEQANGIAPDYEFIIRYPEESPELLAGLVQFCQEKGSKVQLVQAPYFPPFAQKMTNRTAFKQAIEQATHQSVLDLSQAIAEREMFADFQHLNQEGSKIYIDSLIANGIFE